MQYLERVVPELHDPDGRPHLRDHRARCEALDAFHAVQDSRDEAFASGWAPEAAV